MIAPLEHKTALSLDEVRDSVEKQAKIFKALGHPTRLYLAMHLRQGEQCVCDLQALVGDDISTVSRHLNVLREADIVNSRKVGSFMYYSLKLTCLETFVSCIADM